MSPPTVGLLQRALRHRRSHPRSDRGERRRRAGRRRARLRLLDREHPTRGRAVGGWHLVLRRHRVPLRRPPHPRRSSSYYRKVYGGAVRSAPRRGHVRLAHHRLAVVDGLFSLAGLCRRTGRPSTRSRIGPSRGTTRRCSTSCSRSCSSRSSRSRSAAARRDPVCGMTVDRHAGNPTSVVRRARRGTSAAPTASTASTSSRGVQLALARRCHRSPHVSRVSPRRSPGARVARRGRGRAGGCESATRRSALDARRVARQLARLAHLVVAARDRALADPSSHASDLRLRPPRERRCPRRAGRPCCR